MFKINVFYNLTYLLFVIAARKAASKDLLPCSYRGTLFLHGNDLKIDECTTCSCDNSTVKCDIKSCQPTFCDEPITDPDECCDLCPYCK